MSKSPFGAFRQTKRPTPGGVGRGSHLRAVDVLGKRQGHGIHEHRPDVEEVAVQQTASQQYGDIDGDIPLLRGTVPQQEADRLEAVEGVGRQAHDAAGRGHLDQGVVPPGREEGGERLGGGPIPGHILPLGEETAAKDRMLGELLHPIDEQVVPLGHLEQLLEKQGEHIHQLIKEHQTAPGQHHAGHQAHPDILPPGLLLPKKERHTHQEGHSRHHDRGPGAGEHHPYHQHDGQHGVDPAMFSVPGQVEGEGQHHRHHAADIVVHPPAGVDQLPVDGATVFQEDPAAEIVLQQLGQYHEAYAHPDPGHIVLPGLFPEHRSAEQVVRGEHRQELKGGEEQILLPKGGVLLHPQAAGQIGDAQQHHAAQEPPGRQKERLPADLRVCDQPPKEEHDKHAQNGEQVDPPILRQEDGVGVGGAARIIGRGGRHIAQDHDRHQTQQVRRE